ncbi:MAG: hypothetical protein IPK83_18930 [Planctomycetes bacterium]|nr:hypothetical protein [Planctomycetota bacterium]
MKDIAYRVIADHIRTLTFALTDGAVPSNEGRGFVLRRILRRAVRYGRQYLGTREPFMCNLVPAVAEAMGIAFPELNKAHGGKNVEHVADLIRDEEASFIKTLDRGIALFNEAAEYARTHHRGRIGGEDAFKLHDTFGFPIDLTELMAEEQGLTVDIGEYERRMEEAKERARGSREEFKNDDLAFVLQQFGGTTKFVGYHCLAVEDSQIRFILEKDESGRYGSAPSRLDSGKEGALVLDRTPFYAVKGGQVADTGLISVGANSVFRVTDTIEVAGTIVHLGACEKQPIGCEPWEMSSGIMSIKCFATVDIGRRQSIMFNHTATHIMNWALREVLGDHVQQKGSLVDDEKTRFDLSHNAAITEVELAKIESLTNEQIGRDLPVYTENEVDQSQARHINTLRAVFGEKYPEKVRVVSVGAPINEMLADPKNAKWMGYSVEFCGGTHVKRTSEIGRFRLVEESAVSKGVRRVVGVTGEHAQRVDNHATTLARLLKDAGHADAVALPQRIAEITAFINENELPVVEKMRMRADIMNLQDKAKKAQKEAAKSGTAEVISHVDDLLTGAIKAGNISIICGHLSGATPDQLRAAADSLRARAGSAAVLLASDEGGKVTLLAAMTPDVVQKGVKAGDLIKEIAGRRRQRRWQAGHGAGRGAGCGENR